MLQMRAGETLFAELVRVVQVVQDRQQVFADTLFRSAAIICCAALFRGEASPAPWIFVWKRRRFCLIVW
jgi:hypothetical protein